MSNLNEALGLTWTIVYQHEDTREIFKERRKREKTGNPLDFLCLAVTRRDDGNNNFRDIESARTWIEHYRRLEEDEVGKRINSALAGDKVLPLVPVSILVLVDPIYQLEKDEQVQEYQRREELTETGAILLERPDTDEDDTTIFSEVMNSALRASTPTNSAAMATLPHFLRWKPTPPETAGAEIYGKQPSHTDLPSNDELRKIFETYRKADWRDLDY